MRRPLERALKGILGCDVVIVRFSGKGLGDRVDGLAPFRVGDEADDAAEE